MKKYRKKPIVIEAIQFWMNSLSDIQNWITSGSNYLGGQLTIKTLEGDMVANVGDWIIKGIKGEFYPCKNDIFKATYEEVIEDTNEN